MDIKNKIGAIILIGIIIFPFSVYSLYNLNNLLLSLFLSLFSIIFLVFGICLFIKAVINKEIDYFYTWKIKEN